MRNWINLMTILVESLYLDSFEDLAKRTPDVNQFLKRTDGMNALYRGHTGDHGVENNSFMTDYIGHAEAYGDYIDAYAYDENDVWFFNNDRFAEMCSALRRLDDEELDAVYKKSLTANRFAQDYENDLEEIRRVIESDDDFSEISMDFEQTNRLVPLMQEWAWEKKGKNIIAFLGGDYREYGGQNEFVVRDVSKLVDLRSLHSRMQGHDDTQ